jgi:predicted alpha-1,2-mannosidase
MPASAADVARHVNPFIGATIASGNTYPGAQAPFGMISWSPQSTNLNGTPGGYHFSQKRLNGFGLIHLSGAGCAITCELPFIPCAGELNESPVTRRSVYGSDFSHTNEVATPGYYSVGLSTYGIRFENTVTLRSGIAHLDFPATNAAHVVLNPTANGSGLFDGRIEINPAGRSLSGWARSGNFCGNKGSDYTVYFWAEFDRPFSAFGTWTGEQKNPSSSLAQGPAIASYLSFDCTERQRVSMKVGISFVSVANAKLNLNAEIPAWDFEAVRSATREDWNQRLSRVEVSGGSPDDTTIFYTALYHALLLPSVFEDVNGEYIGMDGQTHKVEPGHHSLATFSGWDTYRTQAQLWGLLYPDMAADFCASLLAMARETQYKGGGGLPLWSLYNDETKIMAGYPADPFIASAYAFGATNIDLAAAKAVMVDSGLNQRWCGRKLFFTWENLPEYKKYGYCPNDATGFSCSRNVEYCTADFSIAQVCKATGDLENYRYFLGRAQSVFNLIHPESGYLQPRKKDGQWVTPFDPYSGNGFMEGNSAHYTWTIGHNLARLIEMMGGREKAEARLDDMTSQLATGYAYQSRYYEAGNEPCFGIMPVYNWLQRPWKAQARVREVMLKCFKNTPDGIPGDDDSGAMSAWYLFCALGMYPEIPGVGGVTVLSPLFPEARLNLSNGRRITILARNASPDAKYIQSMTVNGKANSRLWLDVNELRRGATLKYVMGDQPNTNWAASAQDVPPSYGAEAEQL